ncbi:DUF4287 domain-containing protein [Janibacter melonis]|uniref:DUF4287 domain-containing protein n=1 Tax=Janibacter melonis TaxID=262209 RepID=A0A176QGE0_9MICO|nr:DUF4287 domain-containing protein [Janibacter melonis]MBD5831304.1 DUF4287 domain-containing protein [Janibacter melonis]MCM3555545.1 DUF4287 domain-containing protein [Janibacter melonis]OAB88740.1 hypothetical protein AWH69_02850 [Janibacter melonis]
MTTHRVQAPVIGEGEKVTGPASYFPAIERTYDRPVQDWLDMAADALETRTHMEVVGMLKQEHGLGHGHANAVVAYVRAAQDG